MKAHFMILRGRCQHDFIYLMHIKRAAKHADMATGLLHHTHVHIRRTRARAGLAYRADMSCRPLQAQPSLENKLLLLPDEASV